MPLFPFQFRHRGLPPPDPLFRATATTTGLMLNALHDKDRSRYPPIPPDPYRHKDSVSICPYRYPKYPPNIPIKYDILKLHKLSTQPSYKTRQAKMSILTNPGRISTKYPFSIPTKFYLPSLCINYPPNLPIHPSSS